MSMADDWSTSEIVRTLARMESKLDSVVAATVPREVFEQHSAHVNLRLNELGTKVADLDADQERHRREHAEISSSNWRAWVVPIVIAVVVATLAVIGGAVTRGVTG